MNRQTPVIVQVTLGDGEAMVCGILMGVCQDQASLFQRYEPNNIRSAAERG